ncbi:hypothetical protein ABZ547_08210 [Streptomyces sparsogenes]|uniref:hypothetical protein n=1 Tax=Streptomyces sparsogenes TaxID=67365 RepID=UPI0033FD3A72
MAATPQERKYEGMPAAFLREQISRYSKVMAEARKGGRSDLVAVGHEEINAMIAELEARGELQPEGN